MQNTSIDYWIALIAAMAAVVLYVGYYLSKNVWNPTGKGADRRTRNILSRFAMLRQYKVLSGVQVNDKNGQTHTIENMMVGCFGILLVETLGARGEFYGAAGEEKWVLVRDANRSSFDNPLLLLEKQKAALRQKFAEAKLYSIPIESAVYISSTAGKTNVFLSADNVFHGGKFSEYLHRSIFEKDNNVDVEKIISLLGFRLGQRRE